MIPTYHEQLWDYHQMTVRESEKVVNEGSRRYETFGRFGGKVFSTLFGGKVYDQEAQPKAGEEWAEKAYQGMNLGDSQTLMRRTKGNDWWSGIASTTFLSEFLEKVAPPSEKVEDPTSDEQVAEYLRRLAAKQEDKELAADIEAEAKQRMDAAQAKRENAEREAALMDDTEIRNAVRAAAARTNAILDDIENAMDGMGLGAGDGTHSGRKERTEIAKKLSKVCANNKEFARVMEVAGRLRRIAESQQRNKPNKGVGEITGVETGNSLPRLLASQFLDSFDDEREPLFFRKYQKKALLQYEKTQKEDEGRGPVVLVVDTSGSMGDGDAAVWAQATTLAYLDIARKQKRSLCIIHFASSVVGKVMLEGDEMKDVDKIIDAVSFAPSGGTVFMEPLQAALETITGSGTKWKKADIVMVTDGDAPVDPTWLAGFNAERKQYGTRVSSILVGQWCSPEMNKLFSDEVVELADAMRDDSAMHHLFATV